MAHVIGRGRYARETYPSPPRPPPSPPPLLPFNVVVSEDDFTVPAFGSVIVGPFTFTGALEFIVTVLDLDIGFRATWGGFADGEVTYQQLGDGDPPGQARFRLENTSAGDKHVNFRVVDWF